jgi:uroporphyrinogen decarboxylase
MQKTPAALETGLAPRKEHPSETPGSLTCRERFLRACACRPVDRPPVWLMRQAGRSLPEYRALRENFTFLELVRHPHLAAEVTLQPIRRFGFDAAIVFSDILVIPEALGQSYFFREGGGVEMAFRVRNLDDVRRLETGAVCERLAYVAHAIQLARKGLGNDRALIGFAGSPWTLANFMLTGGSAHDHTAALEWIDHHPFAFDLLMEKLTAAVTDFVRMQVAAGADVIQIFDTLGGLLPLHRFRAGSGDWIARIVAGLEQSVPAIVFSKGARNWVSLYNTRASVLGIDHQIDLAEATENLPDTIAVQGNLDPAYLLGDPSRASAATNRLLLQMDGRNGWIFNLGHGVPAAARLESISAVVETIRR